MPSEPITIKNDLGNQIIELTMTVVAKAGQYQMSLLSRPAPGIITPVEAMKEQTEAMHKLCTFAYVLEREYHRRVWIGGDPAQQVKKMIHDQVNATPAHTRTTVAVR